MTCCLIPTGDCPDPPSWLSAFSLNAALKLGEPVAGAWLIQGKGGLVCYLRDSLEPLTDPWHTAAVRDETTMLPGFGSAQYCVHPLTKPVAGSPPWESSLVETKVLIFRHLSVAFPYTGVSFHVATLECHDQKPCQHPYGQVTAAAEGFTQCSP